MKYEDFLKRQGPKCPFCHKKRSIIHHTKKAYITYGLAPYHEHHMLVVPRRHITDLTKLHALEEIEIQNLIKTGISILNHLGYRDYSILVRNGKNIGKTVSHVHYHLVPKAELIALKKNAPKELQDFVREILTPAQIKKTVGDLKKAFSKIKTASRPTTRGASAREPRRIGSRKRGQPHPLNPPTAPNLRPISPS
jgi:diadenosine tetraphosphate (Ap4A) HIT family hydrolase